MAHFLLTSDATFVDGSLTMKNGKASKTFDQRWRLNEFRIPASYRDKRLKKWQTFLSMSEGTADLDNRIHSKMVKIVIKLKKKTIYFGEVAQCFIRPIFVP